MGWRDIVGRFNRSGSVPEENSGDVLLAVPDLRPPTIAELVQRYVRDAVSARAVDEGMESFEEADDFEEEDPDVIPMTHHEVVALNEDELRGVAAGYGIELGAGSTGRVAPPPKEPASPPAGGEPG